MKLKTLNAHPSLFFDLRALVERVADSDKLIPPVGPASEHTDKRACAIYCLSGEARDLLERFEKLEAV